MFFLPSNILIEDCSIYLSLHTDYSDVISSLKAKGKIELYNSSLDHTKPFSITFKSTSDFEFSSKQDFLLSPDLISKMIFQLSIHIHDREYRYVVDDILPESYLFYKKENAFEFIIKVNSPQNVTHYVMKGNPFVAIKD